MVDLDILKFHLRVDDDYEDDYLSLIMNAAIRHVSAMTGIQNDETATEDYDLAVMLLSSHWFTNREIINERGSNPVPYGYAMLIQNLRTDGFF
ncbi:head-tail connector protein [Cereibacter changlensis]|uniref:head-tail connector protein n=1 Tax=Cereibacter changlensis TaxID=402884 RepID=UPI0040348845